MPNMKSRININNKTVSNPKPSIQVGTYNCINKSKWPLNNKCLINNLLHKTNVTLTSENYRTKTYYGRYQQDQIQVAIRKPLKIF